MDINYQFLFKLAIMQVHIEGSINRVALKWKERVIGKVRRCDKKKYLYDKCDVFTISSSLFSLVDALFSYFTTTSYTRIL